jgi:hypothetical protein
MPPISTLTQPGASTAPRLGRGIGGAGGTRDGGWVCVCGNPTCSAPSVIAGSAGNSAAMGAVSVAKPVSMISLTMPPTSMMSWMP